MIIDYVQQNWLGLSRMGEIFILCKYSRFLLLPSINSQHDKRVIKKNQASCLWKITFSSNSDPHARSSGTLPCVHVHAPMQIRHSFARLSSSTIDEMLSSSTGKCWDKLFVS